MIDFIYPTPLLSTKNKERSLKTKIIDYRSILTKLFIQTANETNGAKKYLEDNLHQLNNNYRSPCPSGQKS